MKIFGYNIERVKNSITSADLHSMMLGRETASGVMLSPSSSLFETTAFRCVVLISNAISMLPLRIMNNREVAKENSLYKLLKAKPNGYQNANIFKSSMQVNLLKYGCAYAQIVRGVGGRIIALLPIHPDRVKAKLTESGDLIYEVRADKETKQFTSHDIFSLLDISEDGYTAIGRVERAREAIGLSKKAEQSTAEVMKAGNGEGFVSHPRQLTDIQYKRLKASIVGYNLLEDGMTASQSGRSARDNQHLEQRKFQIEEIGRVFGVPRPLLMVDDTSWGSGISALGIFFIQYCLQPYFTLWEDAINTQLLGDEYDEGYYAKFNEKALLRGTIAEQGAYFASALGSGGGKAWMDIDEVRELNDMPPNEKLSKEGKDEPVKTA